MHWCNSVDDLIDFLAYVAVYAPDEFPDEDGELLNLATAFEEIEHGIAIATAEISSYELLAFIKGAVLRSKQKYYDGNVRDAARELVDAQYALRNK